MKLTRTLLRQASMIQTYKYLSLMIIVLASTLTAAPKYIMQIENETLTDDCVIEFEVVIKSIEADFNLTSYQCSFSFNNEALDKEELEFSYIDGTSELSNPPSSAIGNKSFGENHHLTFASRAGNDVIPTEGKVIGKFRIENSKPILAVNPNLFWDFDQINNTILTDELYRNIVNPDNHEDLYFSLSMNVVTLDAAKNGSGIELEWETTSNFNYDGFEVERAENNGGELEWKVINYIQADLNSLNPTYEYIDQYVNDGSYFYRIKEVDLMGKTIAYSQRVKVDFNVVTGIDETLPREFSLNQNYPNPFNPSTKIKYSVPRESAVKVTVYNILGEMVTELVNEIKEAGYFEIDFNASNLNSGMYIYTIEASSIGSDSKFTDVKKMMLVK